MIVPIVVGLVFCFFIVGLFIEVKNIRKVNKDNNIIKE